MRWDPRDPAQRRARYALLSGMWAFFFALFGWRELALLLGALALYWGVSSLRAKQRRADPTAAASASGPRSAAGSGSGGARSGSGGARSGSGSGSGSRSGADSGARAGTGRPMTTAAVTGLVTATLALVMVATAFAAQLVYSDYYTCVDDALTTSAEHSCEHLLPDNLRTLLGSEP